MRDREGHEGITKITNVTKDTKRLEYFDQSMTVEFRKINNHEDTMLNIIKHSIMTIIPVLCLVVFIETIDAAENPYPVFIPYVDTHDTVAKHTENLDIRKLGLEQPTRWLTPDPHADNYPGWSPFVYVGNNPLAIIDPDGRDWYDINGTIIWFDHEGDLEINYNGEMQTFQSLGKNVLVSYHMREDDGSESVNAAWHFLYLETDTDGPTARIEGNTVPADIETMNTLAEGLYSARFQGRASRQQQDGTNPDQAIIINEGRNVPNTKDGTMNQIFFHQGNTHRASLTTNPNPRTGQVSYISRGCIVGPSGPGSLVRYNDFMKHAKNFNGNYYLRSNRIRR